MEPNCDFVWRENLMLHPIPTVSEQCTDSVLKNFMNLQAKITFGISVLPSPPPCFVEHAPMQFSDEQFIKRVDVGEPSWAEYPSSC